MRKSIIPFLLFLLFVLACILCAHAGATTVTGTVKFQGQPLTGYYDVALSYPATTGSYIALPGANPDGHSTITNGSIGILTLEGNDTLLPRGSYYQFTFYNAYGSAVSSLKYVITGSTFDIGTAVPTPITPANINYLDLLGLRNLSAQNLVLTNALSFTGGATYAASGVSGAKVLMDVRYAAAYALGSTTCGVQEALTSLPSTGGTIVLQLGPCSVTSTITIAKPVRVWGHGRGGGSPSGGLLAAPSTLVNAQLAAPLFKIQPAPVTAPLSGIEFSDFAIIGNSSVGGASSGDCVDVVGGSPSNGSVSDVTFDAMFIYGCFGSAIHASDGVKNMTVTRSFLSTSGGSGILLDSPNAGLLTNTVVETTRASGNTLSGLTITGATVGAVTVSQSTFASNLVDGINLVSGSTAAVLSLSTSTLTDNHNAGLWIADGQGSTVADCQFTPGIHQLFGINAPLPTLADAFATQLTLRGNLLQGNLTFDLVEGAATTYLLFYPQTERLGGTGVNYSLLAPNSVHYIQPSVAVARTCNANGCYRIEQDGTIEQWGSASGCGAGTAACNQAVTFPTAFTTTTDLRVTVTEVGGNNNWFASHLAPSTSGFTVQYGALTFVGGTGTNLSGSQTADWYAIGH